jgi:hypothetical protein
MWACGSRFRVTRTPRSTTLAKRREGTTPSPGYTCTWWLAFTSN